MVGAGAGKGAAGEVGGGAGGCQHLLWCAREVAAVLGVGERENPEEAT